MSEINCYGDELIYNEVVPGYILVQLVNVPDEITNWDKFVKFGMQEGGFGLTWCNDPDFVFNMPPMLDPFNEDDDGDITDEEMLYLKTLRHYQTALTSSVDIGYRLVTACIEAGYNPHEDGFVAGWLMERMYHVWKEGVVREYLKVGRTK